MGGGVHLRSGQIFIQSADSIREGRVRPGITCLIALLAFLSSFFLSPDAWSMGEEPSEEVTEALLSEPLACQSYNLKVHLGPDPEFWELAQDYTSGKRVKPTQALLMEFSRTPDEGEECLEDTSGEENVVCLKSGEKVAVPENCPSYPEYETELAQVRLEVEGEPLMVRSRRVKEVAQAYFERIHRCMRGLDPNLVENQFQLTGRVRILDGEKVACNDPRLKNAQTEEYVTHEVPVEVSDYLGMGLHAIVYPQEDFFFDCQYTVELGEGAFTEQGWCLTPDPEALEGEKGFQRSFWIAPDDRTPFERETRRRAYDLKTGTLRSFEIREDYEITIEELFPRYYKDLKIRMRFFDSPDQLVALGEPRYGFLNENSRYTYFAQRYRGLPVIGGGYTVAEENGRVRSVFGKFIKDLSLEVNPLLTQQEAVNLALWEIPAEVYSPATQSLLEGTLPEEEGGPELVIFSPKEDSLSSDDYRLAWKIDLASAKPLQAYSIFIAADTVDGELLKKVSNIPGSQYSYPEGFTIHDLRDADQVVTMAPAEALTLYDGPKNDFNLSRVDVGQNSYYLLYNQEIEFLTWYHDKLLPSGDFDRDYMIDEEFNDQAGANVWDTELQKSAVSVHWAVNKMVDYLKMLGFWEHFFPNLEEGKRYIQAAVSFDPEDNNGPPLAWYTPDAVWGQDMIVFTTGVLGFQPAVSPDIVGHEFYHWLLARLQPQLGSGMQAIALEGFADFLGIVLKCSLRAGPCSWKFGEDTRPDRPGFWDISDPASGDLPDAYGSDFYRQLLDSCDSDPNFENDIRCNRSKSGYLASRALWFLSNGGSEAQTGVNGLGCEYSVQSIDPDPALAREKLAKMILYFSQSVPFGSYLELMDARHAMMMFGKEAGLDIKNIAQAWHAVGVGDAFEELDRESHPGMGQGEVEPWPAKIRATVLGEGEYEIQVSHLMDFSEMAWHKTVTSQSAPEDEGRFVEAEFVLDSDEPAYWRIRPAQGDGVPWGNCAKTQYFRTQNKTPHLIAPKSKSIPRVGGAPSGDGEPKLPEVDPWRATFSWHPVEGADRYFLAASEFPDAYCPPDQEKDNPALQAHLAATKSLAPVSAYLKLEADTEYYYFLAAVKDFTNEAGENDFYYGCSLDKNEEGIPFKTRDPIPNPRSPADGEKIGGGEVTLSWQNVPGASGYKVQVSTDAEFTQLLSTGEDPSGNSLKVTIGETGTYYWRVQALPPEGLTKASSWSEARSFSAVPVPVPTSPINGEFEPYDVNPVNFNWEIIPEVSNYRFNLYENNSGQQGAMIPGFPLELGSTDTSTLVPGWLTAHISVPDPKKGYCWSLQASLNNEVGPESAIHCYKVAGCYPDPVFPNTSKGAWQRNVEYDPAHFAWFCQAAEGQEFQFGIWPNGADVHRSPALFSQKTTQTSIDVPLEPNTEYEWWVYAILPDGSKGHGTGGPFETKEGPDREEETAEEESGGCEDLSGVTPRVNSPPSGSDALPKCVTSNTTFDWNSVGGATSYTVEVSYWNPLGVGDIWQLVNSYSISQSNTKPLLVVPQFPGNRYLWCVQAKNSCSTSERGCSQFLMPAGIGSICY